MQSNITLPSNRRETSNDQIKSDIYFSESSDRFTQFRFIGWDELTHTLQSGFYLTVFLYHPTGIPKCTLVDGKSFIAWDG